MPALHVTARRIYMRVSCGFISTFVSQMLDKRGGQKLAAESRLLSAIEGTQSGLNTSATQREDILNAVSELEELGRGLVTTSHELSATWKLLWTTEKARFTLIITRAMKVPRLWS